MQMFGSIVRVMDTRTFTHLDLSRLSPDKSLLFSSVHLWRKTAHQHDSIISLGGRGSIK